VILTNIWTHIWVGRFNHPDRHGQRCRIFLVRNGKYLIEFKDGKKTVTVRGTFRKLTKEGRQ